MLTISYKTSDQQTKRLLWRGENTYFWVYLRFPSRSLQSEKLYGEAWVIPCFSMLTSGPHRCAGLKSDPRLFLFLSRKLEQADAEPADFLSPTIPQAVSRLCKHTFPPSSPPLPARWRPAVGLLAHRNRNSRRPVNWHHPYRETAVVRSGAPRLLDHSNTRQCVINNRTFFSVWDFFYWGISLCLW